MTSLNVVLYFSDEGSKQHPLEIIFSKGNPVRIHSPLFIVATKLKKRNLHSDYKDMAMVASQWEYFLKTHQGAVPG